MIPARVNECGHPERKHVAKGRCVPCYMKARNATPERKAQAKAHKNSLLGRVTRKLSLARARLKRRETQ